MASISSSISLLRFKSLSFQPAIFHSKHRISVGAKVRFESRRLPLRVICCCSQNDKRVEDEVERGKYIVVSDKYIGKLRETVGNLAPALFVIKRQINTNFAIGLCVAVLVLVISVRDYLIRKSRHNHHGSVADLVKRGQLRSDRRSISKPLKYDDPFNNPLVKVSKGNSTVEMCGKVYRLAPVTLTEKEQSSHQKRRSRAYQWKRPTIFLKEGDPLPPDVDPNTVRWIPANHPFVTTVSDIDESLAQSNVYQKRGVPFRIKAEHEALQKKLEALHNEQKLNKLAIDPSSARDFERPFKSSSQSQEHTEQGQSANQGGNSTSPKSDGDPSSARDFERPFKSSSQSQEHTEQGQSANQGGNSTSPKSDGAPRSSETSTSFDEPGKP